MLLQDWVREKWHILSNRRCPDGVENLHVIGECRACAEWRKHPEEEAHGSCMKRKADYDAADGCIHFKGKI